MLRIVIKFCDIPEKKVYHCSSSICADKVFTRELVQRETCDQLINWMIDYYRLAD